MKSGVDPERIITAAEAYAKSDNVRRGFAKHPTTWLNGECWNDELEPATATRGGFRSAPVDSDGMTAAERAWQEPPPIPARLLEDPEPWQ